METRASHGGNPIPYLLRSMTVEECSQLPSFELLLQSSQRHDSGKCRGADNVLHSPELPKASPSSYELESSFVDYVSVDHLRQCVPCEVMSPLQLPPAISSSMVFDASPIVPSSTLTSPEPPTLLPPIDSLSGFATLREAFIPSSLHLTAAIKEGAGEAMMQAKRFDGDLYTPIWTRGRGNDREGLCMLCEPPRWFKMKQSAYWYRPA